jgi:hypothetical protein
MKNTRYAAVLFCIICVAMLRVYALESSYIMRRCWNKKKQEKYITPMLESRFSSYLQ